jgi:prepilin-type N-terminal cleavage/methylation domain-containing protein
MASRRISTTNRGFTLIEILIAMAITVILISLGVFLGLDALRGSYTRSERDTIVSLLTQARSRSMANIDESAWGVCVADANYVVFKGNVCDPAAATSELTPVGAGAVVTGLAQASPAVFTALSGTTTSAAISIAQHNRTSNISINYEGTIIW